MEKHWKSVIHKSICDYFFEVQGRVHLMTFLRLLQPRIITSLTFTEINFILSLLSQQKSRLSLWLNSCTASLIHLKIILQSVRSQPLRSIM